MKKKKKTKKTVKYEKITATPCNGNCKFLGTKWHPQLLYCRRHQEMIASLFKKNIITVDKPKCLKYLAKSE